MNICRGLPPAVTNRLTEAPCFYSIFYFITYIFI